MKRKVFLSFLGKTDYSPCIYRFPDGSKSPELRYIQEATLLNLVQHEEWTSSDVAYILITDNVMKRNWYDNGHIKEGKPTQSEGLKSRLERAGLPMTIHAITGVPECIDIDEIMLLFSKIYDLLEDGDTLYLDLTHGYRYFPMLILVLSAYSRFLKNIEVKSITYGNFEATNEKEKPVIDLISLASILDWTFAAGQYVKSGNVDELVRLGREELKPILKKNQGNDKSTIVLKNFIKALENFIDERRFCRGKSIILSTNYSYISDRLKELDDTNIVLPAFKPILDKISSTFNGLDTKENIRNGYLAAKWCFENGLYQQAITILQENMIAEVCMEVKIDWLSEEYRQFLGAAKTRTSNSKAIIKLPNVPNNEEIFNAILNSESWNRIKTDYQRLSEYRNNINHSEMNRSGQFNIKDFKKAIQKALDTCLNNDAD